MMPPTVTNLYRQLKLYLGAHMSNVKEMLKNMNRLLVSTLAPFQMQMAAIGMRIEEFEMHDDEKLTVIIGLKVSFTNADAYKKFLGVKK